MRVDSITKPKNRLEEITLNKVLKQFTRDKKLPALEGKKMRCLLRDKMYKEAFTNCHKAWESIHAPPAPEPAPAPAKKEEEKKV